jgi:serine/threonine protein kinase/Flp pilus assembly protein TadD
MIGRTVSHYRVTAKIGEGGMGVVYLADDTLLERKVALKFISREDFRHGNEKERLMREGQAAASLNHPNICTIFEMNEFEGRLFIAMEYVQGRRLSSLISEGPLNPEQAADIAGQILAGIEHAHRKGVIHRDIKPDNIMITDEGRVKIMDFGIALAENKTRLTVDGTTMGTVAYMSPEQVVGEEVDGRSDLWSVGAILYEMLTGEQPFRGEHQAALLYSIVNEEPRPMEEISKGIPEGLSCVAGKALLKDKDRRYQDAEQMLADLRSFSREGTVSRSQARGSGSMGRYKVPLIAVSVIVIIALISIYMHLGPLKTAPEKDRKMIAVLPFDNLGDVEDRYFAEGMTEEITSRLSMIGDLGVISRTSSRRYAGTEKSIAEIGCELGVSYILEGAVRWSRTEDGRDRVRITPQLIRVSDDTHIWAESYDRLIEDIFAIQTEIARNVALALNINLISREYENVSTPPTKNLEAYNEYLQGNYYANRPHFTTDDWNSMMASYRRAIELDPGFALVHAKLASAHAGLRYYLVDLSGERVEMARRAAERALELAPNTPKVHVALASYHLYLNRDTEAAMKEIRLAEDKLHRDADLLKVKGHIYFVLGRYEDARDAYLQAFELSPREAGIQTEIAINNWVMRRYQEAYKAAEKAIEIAPDALWSHLAVVLIDLSWKGGSGRGREALDKVVRSHPWSVYMKYYHSMLTGDYRNAIEALEYLPGEWLKIKVCKRPKSLFAAQAYEMLGEREKAQPLYQQARDSLEVEVAKWPQDPRLHSSLGITYAHLGRKDDAIREGKRAMELLPVSKDAFYGIPYEWNMAVIYTITGEREEALRMIERLLDIPSWISPQWLRSDPDFSPLHSDPEFERILKDHPAEIRN